MNKDILNKLFSSYSRYSKLYTISDIEMDSDMFELMGNSLNYVLLNAKTLLINPRDIKLKLNLSYYLEPASLREVLKVSGYISEYGSTKDIDLIFDKKYDTDNIFVANVSDFLHDYPAMSDIVNRFTYVDNKNYLLDIINRNLDDDISQSELDAILED